MQGQNVQYQVNNRNRWYYGFAVYGEAYTTVIDEGGEPVSGVTSLRSLWAPTPKCQSRKLKDVEDGITAVTFSVTLEFAGMPLSPGDLHAVARDMYALPVELSKYELLALHTWMSRYLEMSYNTDPDTRPDVRTFDPDNTEETLSSRYNRVTGVTVALGDLVQRIPITREHDDDDEVFPPSDPVEEM